MGQIKVNRIVYEEIDDQVLVVHGHGSRKSKERKASPGQAHAHTHGDSLVVSIC